MLFREIQSIQGVRSLSLAGEDVEIAAFYYDSRLIPAGSHGTFFALVSDRGNGHEFIPDLLEKGIRNWVVSEEEWYRKLSQMPDQTVALAENPLKVMAELAAKHRSHFTIPIIGITGSNGKTIVKEWLCQILEGRFSVCRNPKSFNSQIGVPLSVWNLNTIHNIGVFEAGISEPGEMAVLENIIKPDLGLLTNLGSAHQEGFPSEDAKFREKVALFRNCRALILPAALKERHALILREELPNVDIHTWNWEKEIDGKKHLRFGSHRSEFSLPFTDHASLENLGNSISMAIYLGVPAEEIQMALTGLQLPDMRLSLKAGRYGHVLVDDSYTNEPNGLEAAIQFASQQRKSGQHLVLVISDMEGNKTLAVENLGHVLSLHPVYQLITIGSQFRDFEILLPGGHRNFPDPASALAEINLSDFQSSVILIKGTRRFGLERLVLAWQEKNHGTVLEINLDALVHNLNFYRSKVPSGTSLMAMVKALGYGSGDAEIARLLEFHRVDYLAVAYADEGITLREAGVRMPIMVMNPTPEAMDSIFFHQLEPEIYSFRMLELYLQMKESRRHNQIPAVHLKVDTGMRRLGFLPGEVELLSGILRNNQIQVSTVFSHLAGADEDALIDFSLQQIEVFTSFCLSLNHNGIQGFKRHILNSAGILRFPEASMEMVRLGIGLYGIEANGKWQQYLRPVSRLKTVVSQIKEVSAGESVGYGRREFLKKDSRIATIAIGYSDGFRRAFSAGNFQIRWKNHWLPVVGNVCMDMCMIDVSGTSIAEGDEITIFENAEDVQRLAFSADTIPYEILTGIGHRVKRIFYRE